MQKGLPIVLGVVFVAVAALVLFYFLGAPGGKPSGDAAGESESASVTRIEPAPAMPGGAGAPEGDRGQAGAPAADGQARTAGSGAGLTGSGTIGKEAESLGKDGQPVRRIRDTRISRDAESRMVINDAIDMSRQLHGESDNPMEDVQLLDQIVGLYKLIYNMVPGGSENVEVMEVLMGKNEKNVIFFPKDHPDLTDEGVLLDRWGTPYFFHNVSREIMDVTSAGPDRLLHTSDDILLGLQQMADADLGLGSGLEPGIEGAEKAGVKPFAVEPEIEN